MRRTFRKSLKGIVAQSLFKRIDKKGRVAAFEILVLDAAVANLVRENTTHQIPGMIRSAKKLGDQPLDDHVMEHLRMKRLRRRRPTKNGWTGRKSAPSSIRRKIRTPDYGRTELDQVLTAMLAAEPDVSDFCSRSDRPLPG